MVFQSEARRLLYLALQPSRRGQPRERGLERGIRTPEI